MADTVQGKNKKGLLSWAKVMLALMIAVAALVLGVWLSVDNPQPIVVVFLGFKMPAVTLGVLITGLILLGVVVGFLLSMIPTFRLTNEKLSLKRKLRRREKELERLRKAPLTE